MHNASWQEKLNALYQDLQQGFDVSPARILKIEAMLEAVLQAEYSSFDVLCEEIDRLHQTVFDHKPSHLHWLWCQSDGVLRIPYHMQVAPVRR